MLKVLTLSDTGAISFYRGHGPLLEHKDFIEVVHPRVEGQIDWIDIAGADVVFITRALTPGHVELCQQIKDVGKPLILDYDDAIYSLPVSNPNWELHLPYYEPTKKCVALADMVLFSTDGVAADFIEHGAVPETAMFRIVRNRAAFGTRPWNRESKTVAWRGSPTHHRDIDAHLTAIVDYCRSIGATNFQFFGCLHDHLIQKLTAADIAVNFCPSQPLHGYMRSLRELAPHSVVVPLAKCPFNDAKSDIAATEALAAGALPVAFGDPKEFQWVSPVLSHEEIRDAAHDRDSEARDNFQWVFGEFT